MADQKRPYRKQRRAELEEATRRRITESAVELHGTLGPAYTSISAIAEHAGDRGGDNRQEGVEAMRKRIGNLEFDRASHCVYHLPCHVVFCTNFRRHHFGEARLNPVQYAANRTGIQQRNHRI